MFPGIKHQVDMVSHQAVRVYLAVKFSLPMLERVEVITIVVGGGKNRLPIMPPLDDMVRAMREEDSGLSGHDETYLLHKIM